LAFTSSASTNTAEFWDGESGREAVTESQVPLAVRQQHDLAEHSAFPQHLVRSARLFERQPLRNQRLDLALFEQVEQREQVLTEPRRFQPHQPLDAVRHHALSAGLEQIAQDEPTQLSGLANRMTAPAARSNASPTHFRLEAVGHHAAALAQGVAGAPQIVSPD